MTERTRRECGNGNGPAQQTAEKGGHEFQTRRVQQQHRLAAGAIMLKHGGNRPCPPLKFVKAEGRPLRSAVDQKGIDDPLGLASRSARAIRSKFEIALDWQSPSTGFQENLARAFTAKRKLSGSRHEPVWFSIQSKFSVRDKLPF